ncbi:S41 family peptidase [Anaerosporobacter faecicola]|uniref:S41 family peptidase n=1 Tax=Anaerosporobacter faecicola TaxID=2718714 RepID=UPI00143B6AED|nr:S41 family peptidase [Anaerosporobacter faecicola]
MKKVIAISSACILLLTVFLTGCQVRSKGNIATNSNQNNASMNAKVSENNTSVVSSTASSPDTSEDLTELEESPTPEEMSYKTDASKLIEVIEETHASFAVQKAPKDYAQAKEDYINAINDNTSLEEFKQLTKKFLAVFQDGHTHMRYSQEGPFAKLNCMADGKNIYLQNEEGEITTARLIKLGGVSVEKIAQLVDEYYPAENESARNLIHSFQILEQHNLELAGCEFTADGILAEIEDNGVRSVQIIPFVSYEETSRSQIYQYDAVPIESCRMDDIYYIDMNSCMIEEDLMKEQLNQLHTALEDGITKYIIDVRNNDGGYSDNCIAILNELGMSIPEYGFTLRYSPLVAKTRQITQTTGFDTYSRLLSCAKPNDAISLVVLTNEYTFSAATMLGVYVQDGKLGTVIGRKSANAPSCYSDNVIYQMEYSGCYVQIASSYLLRPDRNANQDTLVPDIETELGEDSLKRAIAFLNGENNSDK